MLGEIWKLVEGTEDYYISNFGRFKHGRKVMKLTPDKEGYLRCNLGKNKKRVHRLVATAFVENPNNYPVVDHIDGDKRNNRADNLRWVTPQMNTQAAYDMGLINTDQNGKYVLVLDEQNNGILYATQKEASEETGVSIAGVSKCIRGIEKQRSGYRFIRINTFKDYT